MYLNFFFYKIISVCSYVDILGWFRAVKTGGAERIGAWWVAGVPDGAGIGLGWLFSSGTGIGLSLTR